jgi:Peptidase family M28
MLSMKYENQDVDLESRAFHSPFFTIVQTALNLMQLRSFSPRLALFLAGACLSLVSCSSPQPAQFGSGGLRDNLAAHVQFLAQPKLEGRKTGTAGARLARQYIEARFQACGLVPWPKAKSYELSYGLGKNVVGLLPGSDTNLSGEIVLVSAHYDHEGKDKQGRIYAGACDNASGVAALLETARQLSEAKQRPKRTVAFVSFDAEEQGLFGSFAFTCRRDVEEAKIVAVVNMDMLGRDAMDVVKDTILVTGTASRTGLQAQLRQFGSETGLRVLLMPSDAGEPRTDNAAFENRGGLCLLFSCGPFSDYHRPSDTAERINYTNLERSAKVVLKTVEALANQDQIPSADLQAFDPEELKGVQTIMSELCACSEKVAVKAEDRAALLRLKESIDEAVEKGSSNRVARERFVLEAATALKSWSASAPMPVHFYINYHRELLEAQKRLAAETLKHPPGLFHKLPAFRYVLCDFLDGDISVAQTATNTFALHALENRFELWTANKTALWPLKSSSVGYAFAIWAFDCQGSREELMDYCLATRYPVRTNNACVQSANKLMRAILGAEPQGNYTDWLHTRLAQIGCAGETEWLLHCMHSSNPALARAATGAAWRSQDSRVQDAAREILLNREIRGDVRTRAIWLLARHPNKTNLLALVEVLTDVTPLLSREYLPQLQPDYPLADSPTFWAKRSGSDWKRQLKDFDKTIGQEALANLKLVTEKDFGTDAQAWRKWVQEPANKL